MNPNKRLNFEGNVADEAGGSFYVVDDDGERVAGPFGAASYAQTVRDRIDEPLATDPRLDYEP